jgi:hypothetical protein
VAGQRAEASEVVEWLEAIGDLELPRAAACDTRGLEVPRFIPVVKPQERGTRLPTDPCYAITLASIMTPSARALYPGARTIRRDLGLPKGAALALLLWEKDEYLENLWARRTRARLIEGLVGLGADLVVAPNYSVYGDEPRMAHLINIKRSLVIATELADAGARVVPHIYWWSRTDVARWAAWLRENVEVGWVAINWQTVRADASSWQTLCDGLGALIAAVGREDLGILIGGVTRPGRLSQLAHLLRGRPWAFTNHHVHVVACKRLAYDRSGGAVPFPDKSYAWCLERNIHFFSQLPGRL